MTDLRKALRAAAWKLALRRVAFSACVAVGAGAGLWCVAVLMVGASPRAFAALCVAAAAALLAGVVRARTSVLDAARRVEQIAGWQERLSTAVELEASQSDNAFRDRLTAEAAALVRQHAPAALLPWSLQRPAVIAAALLVAAVVVTSLFPNGLIAERPLSPERRQAAAILGRAIREVDRAPAGREGLRAELVRLLDAVRGSRPLDEVRAELDRVISEVGARSEMEARAIAETMRGSPELGQMADAVGRLDADGVRAAGGNLASQLATIPEDRLKGVSSSLAASAEAAASPGWSSPLMEMGKSAEARDATRLRTYSDILATRVDTQRTQADVDRTESDVLTRSLAEARSALGGPPGASARRTDFFAESKGTGDNATDVAVGGGEFPVRGGAADIKSIYEGARAADAALPQLPDVIEDARSASESDAVPPAYREYIRRYFATDNAAR